MPENKAENKRQPLVSANWKMNLNHFEAIQTVQKLYWALKPDDYDVTITLGNAHFDIGYFSKNNESLTKAREIYAKGLATKPGDVEVQTDVGLTYFLQTPPDLEGAAREFKKSLEKNPNHEKTLQLMIQTLAKQSKTSEATEYLERLRKLDPSSPAVAELSEMVANPKPSE